MTDLEKQIHLTQVIAGQRDQFANRAAQLETFLVDTRQQVAARDARIAELEKQLKGVKSKK